MTKTNTGRVIAAYGRQFIVSQEDGSHLNCVTRGKKTEIACGDYVEVKQTSVSNTNQSQAQGVIEAIAPRSSLLYRSDAMRSKLIAANVSQLIFVLACEPAFSDELLARCLIAAHNENLNVLIVLNKCDLDSQKVAQALESLSTYQQLNYPLLQLSAKLDSSLLRPYLENHTSVLVGQSGMGKSTLINSLIPNADAATREISTALDSGKHTTTHAKLYQLNQNSQLIDCPGVQAFGLHHLTQQQIEASFHEFTPYQGQCRFSNCSHSHEPGCHIREAVADGMLNLRRYELFLQIGSSIKR